MSTTTNRVILSYPTVVTLDATSTAAPRSWIQLAKVGNFVSNKYGKFSITRDDLAQMLYNFKNVTPKAPTELPIDFDHLSMDPKRPGDGAAAAWIKKLELRANGDELWGEVEWTKDGAERVRKKEYRFISPSFVKDHTHKDGTKIGTTLLAAAITNHPFLEGMKAVTLHTPAIAAMHLSDDLRVLVATESAVQCAAIGQRVSFVDDPERVPELTVDERRRVFIVKSVAGEFVRLADVTTGDDFGWFRDIQLAPVRATTANSVPPVRQEQEDVTMHAKTADDELMTLATTLMQQRGLSLRAATMEAGRCRPDLADQRRAEIGVEPAADADAVTRPVINLHAGESFLLLCQRTADERQINLSAAIRLVGMAHPALAEAYGRGESF